MKTLKTNYFNQFVSQSYSKTKSTRLYTLLNYSDNKLSKNNKNSINFVFVNQAMTKKEVENILDWMFRNFGLRKACILAEFLKEGGFKYATQGGISINLEDLKVPSAKQDVMITTQKQVDQAEKLYERGEMTISEWFQKRISSWNVASENLKSEIVRFFEENDPLNPLYIMSFSGARGNLSQVRQLIGMRGLMSDQKGEMIGAAIQANFREGLSVIDFLISSYGARKGLVDTSIRTADSGHMTRRLVDAAHNIIICQFDCRTLEGIILSCRDSVLIKKQKLTQRLIGRVLSKPLFNPLNKKIIASRGQEIDHKLAKLIDDLKIDHIQVRSPLTCQSYHSVCQMCFGWDPIQPRLIEIGEAIGIIAAQSIGEPGTQLTMRTFHTGGVFSRELSEQIRSEFSGQVKFPLNLKTKFIRTLEGDFHQLLETNSFLEVLTYENQTVRLPINRDHLLIIKDKDFIRKGEVIINITSFTTEDSETEVRKTVSTPFAGEIFYEPRQNYNFFEYNFRVWLLAGDLFTLPANAKLIKQRISKNLNKQSFGFTNFVVRQISRKQSFSFSKNYDIENISSFCSLGNINIFKNRNRQTRSDDRIRYLLLLNNKEVLALTEDFLPTFQVDFNLFCLGRFLNKNYQLPSGGSLINLTLQNLPNSTSKIKFSNFIEIEKGGLIAWLNEDLYPISRKTTKYLRLAEGKIIKRYEKGIKNRTTSYSGILRIISSFLKSQKRDSIFIQTASVYSIKRKINQIDSLLSYFDKRFFFPGEKLLNIIEIKEVCYCEIFLTQKKIKFILRPITLLNVIQSKHYNSSYSDLKDINIVLGKRKFLTIPPKQRISFNQVNYLIESGLFLSSTTQQETIKKEIFTNLSSSLKTNFEINFSKRESFSIKTRLPDLVRRETILLSPQISPFQLVEPYSIVSTLNNVGNFYPNLSEIRSQYSTRYRKLLVIDSSHIRTVYSEENAQMNLTNSFIFPDQTINNFVQVNKGGQIIPFNGLGIKFRLGKPYLFTEGAKLYRNHGDLLPVNTVLGFVTYKIFKTQDITQGLPKVEEIFEARRPEYPAIIAKKPCLITSIDQKKLKHSEKETGTFLSLINYSGYSKAISESIYHYLNLNPNYLDVPLYEFINLGERLEKGKIDPHELLEIYFDFYCFRDAHHKACLRSLYRIASIFLHSIQSVYKGQGINIADRQLEVILRQMTRMGIIFNPGDTPLLDGEFLEMTSLDMLNSMLASKNKRQVYYRPTIIGLTKVALHSEGFLSASSFQETTRVLTQAAIEGKRDWLRGLKENVITGHLIPVGSGLSTFSDQWMVKNVFLYGRTLISTNLRQKILNRQKQHRKSFKKNYSFQKSFDGLTAQPFLSNSKKNRI
uniref:DNA-directed RNA polymerase n=1 Tax=Trachydiscus minutus TaxID=1032745 RepID=A0A0D3M5R2_9STRA|nr:plastid-encoded DNA-directed RNA polymerase subunit beta'' [Trachydiscus minutus]AIB04103.1 plastid-encoded DNA-directed RNA polymerase subunit beta'' [Trachydiscus minutus]